MSDERGRDPEAVPDVPFVRRRLGIPSRGLRQLPAMWRDFSWQDEANCRTIGADSFFGTDTEYEDRSPWSISNELRKKARSYCVDCPVKEQCLEFALAANERFGIWGGLTPHERVLLKRRRQRATTESSSGL